MFFPVRTITGETVSHEYPWLAGVTNGHIGLTVEIYDPEEQFLGTSYFQGKHPKEGEIVSLWFKNLHGLLQRLPSKKTFSFFGEEVFFAVRVVEKSNGPTTVQIAGPYVSFIV